MSPQLDRSPRALAGSPPAVMVQFHLFQHLSPVFHRNERLPGSTDCYLVTRQSGQSHLALRRRPPVLPPNQRAQAPLHSMVISHWDGSPPRRPHLVALRDVDGGALQSPISPSPAGGSDSRSIWSTPGRGICRHGRGILEMDCCGRSRPPRTSRRNSRVTTFMLLGPLPGGVCHTIEDGLVVGSKLC